MHSVAQKAAAKKRHGNTNHAHQKRSFSNSTGKFARFACFAV
jgi:hypothetical protein